MGKGPETHHVVPNPHSAAVFLLHGRTLGEQVEETRKDQDASFLTIAPVPAASDRQAPPSARCQRFPDLIEVTSSTHPQLTA